MKLYVEEEKKFTTQWFPLLAFYILKVMIFSPFFYWWFPTRIHGACFPFMSSVSSDMNFTNTALQKQTLRSLVLEWNALRHVTGDRQEESEQPTLVFYHFLKCKRAYPWGNRWPLINVLRCLMAPSPVDTVQYLVFTLPDRDRGRGHTALSSEAGLCQDTQFSSEGLSLLPTVMAWLPCRAVWPEGHQESACILSYALQDRL